MEIFNKETRVDFLGKRTFAAIVSCVLIAIGIASLVTRGLNLGIDFTGGTLVEAGYQQPVTIADIRDTLERAGYERATVQYFGTSRDVMVRVPLGKDTSGADLSNDVMAALRAPYGEQLVTGSRAGQAQQCSHTGRVGDCQVQLRRAEFVGPQFGQELVDKGASALMYALLGVLIYVMFRFEWRFAVGSVVALIHDVLITVGAFSLIQLEFSLAVLAAVLAVIGYSLNDTIVVFDRIRENFRKLRKATTVEVINKSINQTLPRTMLTSVTTLLVLFALYTFGGEVLGGFAVALIIGVLIGTYSSIFVASPVVLALGVSREDLLPPEKEGEGEADVLP